MERKELHDYQTKAIDYIKQRRKCALFLDMGLGKTAITLTAISDLIASDHVSKVLIVAPLRVARSVWSDEAAQWQHLQGLKISVCTGTPKQRQAALESKHDILVINRENVPWLVLNHRNSLDYNMLVIDESSSFKNYASQRFKALSKVVDDFSYVVLLTGTPASNGLHGLWSQIYFIDQGQRLGKNITAFRSRYFSQGHNCPHVWHLRHGADSAIRRAISDVCLSMQAKDYISLPEVMYINKTVPLSKDVLKQYNDFKKSCILEVAPDKEITAFNAAVIGNKLLQYCNGFVYDEDGKPFFIMDEKIKILKDIVDDHSAENILLAYNFKEDLARLKKAFPEAKEMTPRNLIGWNQGKIKMLLAHPASCGHGLNLQHGGSVIVWYSRPWSLELYLQFNTRLHRQGQVNHVRIVSLMTEGTVESDVLNRLKLNYDIQHSLVKYLKASL